MLTKDRQALLGILEAIAKIDSNVRHIKNGDDLFNQPVLFDATLMNFIVIGEMVSRLSEDFIAENQQINWAQIKGFRNIIAHDYFGVDAEEVWQISTTHISRLHEQIAALL